MIIDGGSITWLVLGALILGTMAVVLDRVNFPQRPFQARRIKIPQRGSSRDRTGAHILDESEDDAAANNAVADATAPDQAGPAGGPDAEASEDGANG